MSVADEVETSDRVGMGKDGAMAVSKVHSPQLDVLICRAGGQDGAICRDVHAHDGELVAVQREEEL